MKLNVENTISNDNFVYAKRAAFSTYPGLEASPESAGNDALIADFVARAADAVARQDAIFLDQDRSICEGGDPRSEMGQDQLLQICEGGDPRPGDVLNQETLQVCDGGDPRSGADTQSGRKALLNFMENIENTLPKTLSSNFSNGVSSLAQAMLEGSGATDAQSGFTFEPTPFLGRWMLASSLLDFHLASANVGLDGELTALNRNDALIYGVVAAEGEKSDALAGIGRMDGRDNGLMQGTQLG